MTARVAKLEGNITAADLVGTYAVSIFSNNLYLNPPRVESTTEVGTATLAADGSGSFSSWELGNTLVFQAPAPSLHAAERNHADNFYWTYNNGTLTATDRITGAVIAPPFYVAAGGRVLVAVSRNKGGINTELMIMTRLQ